MSFSRPEASGLGYHVRPRGDIVLDPSSLLLGTTTATLVSSFFTKSAEELGKNTVNAAWHKTSSVIDFLRKKLGGHSDTLSQLESAPRDSAIETSLATAISERAARDATFAKELTAKLKDATNAGADVVFNTNISGSVKNLMNIHSVKILHVK